MEKQMKITFRNFDDIINNSNQEEFLEFAKKYNIFQQSNSKVYDEVCNKIKARLDREGLSHETVRPE
jgi:predicted house-cleaning noncanonical NTP pyrophosphatase (MazG superfamily)